MASPDASDPPGPLDARRRGRQWESLGHGIKARREPGHPARLLERLAAWQDLLPPSAVFTGLTAAIGHGLWLPELPPKLPIFVAAGSVRGEYLPVREELLIARHPTVPQRIRLGNVSVATVPETILECSRWLSLIDVVALADSALARGSATPQQLHRVAAGRRRGAPMLRVALEYADARSESPWETWLRLLHVFGGIDVTPQVNIFGPRGNHVARADLVVNGTRAMHEYDGGQHRDPRQHLKDLRRDRDVIEAGWIRRGYVASDVVVGWIGVLQSAYESRGEVMPLSALRVWPQMLADSALTRQGRDALARRINGTNPQLRCPQRIRVRPGQ